MKKLEQAPRYQRDDNVKGKKTGEFGCIWKIFKILPKELKVLDIACAEGFLVWLARKGGLKETDGIEIDPDRTERGFKHLNLELQTADIFENLDIIRKYDVFILSRFFHNIGEEKSDELMKRINRKRNYMLIIKYKPGMFKENKQKRQPLATKEGLKTFLDKYELAKKSFPQQVIVAAKGKYVPLLKELRKGIAEG